MAKHRVTMGGQPTLPQVFGALSLVVVQIAEAPAERQMVMLMEFTSMMVGTAVAMQSASSPRPVA